MTLFKNGNGGRPVTFELLPPRGLELKSIEEIRPLVGRLEAVTVTDNPMATLRASSIAYGKVARDALGIEVVPNLSCRDRNLLALQSEVIGAHLLGHRSLFIITGDAPRERGNFKGVWEVNSTELCKIVKGMSNGQAVVRGVSTDLTDSVDFSVGGAIVFSRPAELATFRRKVEAGFDYFITQITYDADEVVDFYAAAEQEGVRVDKHIQIGLCPASSAKKIRTISKMPGVKVPEKLASRLESSTDFRADMKAALLELADEVKTQLGGYSIGFHVMPMGVDGTGKELVEELTR